VGGGGFDTLEAGEGFEVGRGRAGNRREGAGKVVVRNEKSRRVPEIGGGEVAPYSRELPGDGGARRVELA